MCDDDTFLCTPASLVARIIFSIISIILFREAAANREQDGQLARLPFSRSIDISYEISMSRAY